MTPDERLARAAAKFGVYEGEAEALLEAAARRLRWRSEHGGKECSTCHEVLPVSAFGPDRRRPDGLAYTCRSCDAERKRERRKEARVL